MTSIAETAGVPELPVVPGALSAAQIDETAAALAQLQLPCGMIPWFSGGHCDPWNHVETAMALAVCGWIDEAERAYDWLVGTQRDDGSWHNYYVAADNGAIAVEDAKLDTNVCAYVAAGVWHHWLITGDSGFLETMWPVVEGAINFVLSMQKRRGEVIWARHHDGTPWSYALLTGSSSIYHSVRCAVSLASAVGFERPIWTESADRLGRVIATTADAFAPKHRWAMDWYYPVLAGALTGDGAVARLHERRSEFVMDGLGVRCVSDRPWVTAAETCECALAYLAVGDSDTALRLFRWAQRHRERAGTYLTGIVYPDQITFPDREHTSYTAAAMLLCADALSGASPASDLFVVHDLAGQ